VNGVTELRESQIADVAAAPVVPAEVPVEADHAGPATAEAAQQEATESVGGAGTSAVPAVGELHVGRTLARIGRDVLVDQLGLEGLLVDVALQMATVDELLEMLERTKVPEWQADVLLDLASGSSADEVALKMSFREETPDDVVQTGAIADGAVTAEPASASGPGRASGGDADDGATEEDALIAGLHTEAAKLSFAVVQGEEELRAAIEDGSFAAWRVFLHPEQRRWAQRDYNGAFRLSGGAGTGKTVVLVHRAVRLQREAQARARE